MVWRESDPDRWATAYDYPAVRDGRVVLSQIPHGRPTGMNGFVMNSRRAVFSDWRVREALILAFNFPWINQRLNGGVYPRIPSYFGNSPLGYRDRAGEAEAALLAPFLADLPPDVLEGYALPPGDAEGRDRRALRRALGLLGEAGWTVQDGVLRDAAGQALAFEILLRPTDSEAVATIWADALASLGIEARMRVIDAAQYAMRRDAYDFDVIVNAWALSLSPGNEQRLYWGSDGRETPGTRNYMGAAEPAIDALIDAILSADSHEDFTAAVRALDRVLMAGRYVVPFWYAADGWLAHDARLAFPDRIPLYGDWIGFLPDLWWFRG
jgi:peptide/nickel transport system substrate-binding protein